MDEQKPAANWVERRAARERNLDTGAPKVWDLVRAAIQDACDSFNENYPQPNRECAAVCNLENGHRIKVSRLILADMQTTYQPEEFEVLVTFEKSPPAVKSVFSGNALGASTFKIEADEGSAYAVTDGKRIAADEISEKILERVLFPAKVRTRPSTRPSSGGSGWMKS